MVAFLHRFLLNSHWRLQLQCSRPLTAASLPPQARRRQGEPSSLTSSRPSRPRADWVVPLRVPHQLSSWCRLHSAPHMSPHSLHGSSHQLLRRLWPRLQAVLCRVLGSPAASMLLKLSQLLPSEVASTSTPAVLNALRLLLRSSLLDSPVNLHLPPCRCPPSHAATHRRRLLAASALLRMHPAARAPRLTSRRAPPSSPTRRFLSIHPRSLRMHASPGVLNPPLTLPSQIPTVATRTRPRPTRRHRPFNRRFLLQTQMPSREH